MSNVWKQCPGCWSAGSWPTDIDHECECGERLVTIDLRHGENWNKVYGTPAPPDLVAAARNLITAYEAEESEHGFPFNFALRDAHRAFAAALQNTPQPVSGDVLAAGEYVSELNPYGFAKWFAFYRTSYTGQDEWRLSPTAGCPADTEPSEVLKGLLPPEATWTFLVKLNPQAGVSHYGSFTQRDGKYDYQGPIWTLYEPAAIESSPSSSERKNDA